MGEVFLTSREAAEYLRLSVDTLARWRCHGTGPEYVKSGLKVLYRRDALDAFTDSRTRTKTRDGE